jgi:hypothetical protein
MMLGNRLLPPLLGLLVLLAHAPTARADLTYQGPRGLAMGGALRAAAISTPSLYVNPAAMALGRLYHLEAAYQYDGAVQGHLANASIVDSTNKIAGGLGATYGVSDPDHADRTAYDLRLGMAVPIANGFSIGGTFKYLHLDQEGIPETGGAEAAANDDPLLDDFTFDAGALLKLGSILSLGVAGYNLTNLGTPEAPLEIGFGVALSLGDVAVVDADAVLDLTTYDKAIARYAVGAEYFAANRYPIRLGYAIDPREETQFVSGGLGYVDQRFSAELGLRQQIVGGGDTSLALSVKFFVH